MSGSSSVVDHTMSIRSVDHTMSIRSVDHTMSIRASIDHAMSVSSVAIVTISLPCFDLVVKKE
jgi:hypothetical protein